MSIVVRVASGFHLRDGRPVLLADEERGGRSGTVYRATVIDGDEEIGVAVKLIDSPDSRYTARLRRLLEVGAGQWGAADDGSALVAPRHQLFRDGRVMGHVMRWVGPPTYMTLAELLTTSGREPRRRWSQNVRVAASVARAYESAGRQQLVLADHHPENVMIDSYDEVCLVDLDDAQLPGDEGWTLSDRWTHGYLAPELLGRKLSEVRRAPPSDAFALGVLVTLLLLDGDHPFVGWPKALPRSHAAYRTPLDENVRHGLTRFAMRDDLELSAAVLPPFVLPPKVFAMLQRCFVEGHEDPSARPSPTKWAEVLEATAASAVRCPRDPRHEHHPDSVACPWCELRDRGGPTPWG